MEMKDTVELMLSDNYKDRFVAEYQQLKIRYEKLKQMVEKWDRMELDFIPTCPRSIYDVQLSAMKTYLDTLAFRAELEEIPV
jgi:hypothetical protein